MMNEEVRKRAEELAKEHGAEVKATMSLKEALLVRENMTDMNDSICKVLGNKRNDNFSAVFYEFITGEYNSNKAMLATLEEGLKQAPKFKGCDGQGKLVKSTPDELWKHYRESQDMRGKLISYINRTDISAFEKQSKLFLLKSLEESLLSMETLLNNCTIVFAEAVDDNN